MVPTEVQKTIIDNPGNTVVFASPGSGKTFVMSEKIKRVLGGGDLREYQGVIAISYTRKASVNLKQRSLVDGIISKNSYFGTIDSFCLTQIILPFGNYVFGHPCQEVSPIAIDDLSPKWSGIFDWIKEIHPDYKDVNELVWSNIGQLFHDGYVPISALELIALYVVRRCPACRAFISSRYRYIFIDEYQDADNYTDELFHEILSLGLCGFVVGDVNQSIFKSFHKESRFLKSLQQDSSFNSFPLSENHRCSLPIINYSNRLLDASSIVVPTTEEGVFRLHIVGAEERVADVLSQFIPKLCAQQNIINKSNIAILVANNRTLKLMDETLTIPHRVIEATVLDMDMNLRSRLYAQLLQFFYSEKMSLLHVIDDYVDYGMLSVSQRSKLFELEKKIRKINEDGIIGLKTLFASVADILLPRVQDGLPMNKLETVLSDEASRNTYKPLSNDEVVIMTLHKSKGLEFDIVFHMNLNEWELPLKKVENGDFDHPIYFDWEQSLNLHYVGVTRARKLCYLITNTLRINSNNETKNGVPSEFLKINNLTQLRKDYRIG